MDFLKLTNSKMRKKIFQLFFLDVDKKYYLRQLERLLGLSVGNIRRELLSLEKTGLFKKEKVGNQVYYFLNKNSALFGDYKNIIFKTIGIAGIMKKELSKIKEIKKAFIFGSFAKNQEDSASDIDLMVIGDIDEDYLINRISKLEDILKREINYHLINETEWKEKIKENSFFKAVDDGPKIEILN